MTEQKTTKTMRSQYGTRTMPFEEINYPGTYVLNWTGQLVRIPNEAVQEGHSPIISFCSKEPCYVTFLSDDPWLPISKARQVAADYDLKVNF